MALGVGTRLGAYEITGSLGVGGMGEVYRATDTKLGRQVAIKTLPSALAEDSERLARFDREAKLLAALNHAHIAVIYGLDEEEGTQYLAMELVEGETLEQKLKGGPLAVEDALHLALQIAEALEAAHEKGVIHRDLKPANIMVTPTGLVKVLDFGLAKAFSGDLNHATPAHSPALSVALTQQGLILGTAGYMSPEQASGQAMDQRADIWAFGVVLYEMLTGLPLFSGESVPHILADVLRTDPNWGRLPKNLHPRVRMLLERCLRKKVRSRYHSISDVRLDIEDALDDPQDAARRAETGIERPRRYLRFGVAAVALGGALAFAAAFVVRPRAPAAQDRPTTRFFLAPPDGTHFYDMGGGGATGFTLALSPDGRELAMVVTDADGTRSLAVRSLDALVPRRLAGTDGATSPFWSPDGRSIAFYAEGKLKRIDASGGDVHVICDSAPGTGGTWNRDGVIVFSPYDAGEGGLARVSAAGGTPIPVTTLDSAAGQTNNSFPRFLPDGHHYLFFVYGGDSAGIYVGDLDSSERTRIIGIDALDGQPSTPAYASGFLLFAKNRALMAQAFDPESLKLSGDAVRIVDRIAQAGPGEAAYTVSANGVLAYWSGEQPRLKQLTWMRRDGSVDEKVGEPRQLFAVALSPDKRQVAMTLYAPDERGWDTAIWLRDLGRHTSTKLTFQWGSQNPVWSPDGTKIAFASPRRTPPSVYRKPSIGGTDQLLFKGHSSTIVSDWSQDGRLVIATDEAGTKWDLWTVPAMDKQKTAHAVPLLQTPFNEFDGRLSPNGQWLAYVSDESGRAEVYVTDFANRRDKWRISTNGGTQPEWRSDGQELYFVAADDTLTAFSIPSEAGFQNGMQTRLFALSPPERAYKGVHQYAASRDGERFLVAVPVGEAPSSQVAIVLNWPVRKPKSLAGSTAGSRASPKGFEAGVSREEFR